MTGKITVKIVEWFLIDFFYFFTLSGNRKDVNNFYFSWKLQKEIRHHNFHLKLAMKCFPSAFRCFLISNFLIVEKQRTGIINIISNSNK